MEIPDYEPVDDNGDHPVTRAEFNDAMQSLARSFENVVTKDDLKQLATRQDFEQFATKSELRNFEERTNAKMATLATKDELTALEERLSAQIKTSSETIVKAVSKHIDSAVESALDRRIAPLERRVSRLEKNARLSPAA